MRSLSGTAIFAILEEWKISLGENNEPDTDI